VLVELGVVEQRYRAVLEVLDEGASVTDVARRYGVARQTVHGWLRRYANRGGLGGLADRSSRPERCPHQMPPEVEARVLGIRRAHPAWGPSRIVWQLEREGRGPLPGRSSVYRALVRHGLVEAKKRKRRREDYRRWERGRAMELWQRDVMGRVHLADGTEVKVVTGIDDHSRFVVCAKVVLRATARPVCQALAEVLRRHGVPSQILTDNGKVFTGRFGRGPGPVMFDRICTDNGIRHLLTAPYSPTTTGKIERLHKTMRAEFFTRTDRLFQAPGDLQDALDAWVAEYNTARPHQSCGGRPPIERFRLASRSLAADDAAATEPAPARPPVPAAGKRLPQRRRVRRLAGASPLQASSGRTTRHRLNRGGDRQLNRALHDITLTRWRADPRTHDYIARRAAGKNDTEIRRALKRYVARELYRALQASPAA
jgi:transposase InsO family protein